jgi:3-deoxy-D-manno-octulosonic-acid transferase
VTGNLKYDLQPPDENALVRWLREEIERSGRGPLLVAGSVIAGEEPAVLEALALVAAQWPDTLLVLAPRRPERFAEAAAVVEQAGWSVVHRSALSLGGDGASPDVLRQEPGGRRTVLLLDSLGELAALYRLADAVFVGGSLVPSGGHNPLEPAAFGVAPVFGPSMENFRDIADKFLSADAAVQVGSSAELGPTWVGLLEDDKRRGDMGKRALELVERHRGATAATLEQLSGFLKTPQAVR